MKQEEKNEPTITEYLTVMRTILQKANIVSQGYKKHDKIREFTIQELKAFHGECDKLSDEKVVHILEDIFQAGMLTTYTIEGQEEINYILE